jgi:hypothetical protein
MKVATRHALVVFAVAVAGGTALTAFVRGARTTEAAFVDDNVPAAAALLAPSGSGFEATATGGYQTRIGPRDDMTGPSLAAAAPAKATGRFELHERGGHRGVTFSLGGARPATSALERNEVVYRNAYEQTDVVVIAGDDHFEVAYVAREIPSAGALRIHVDKSQKESWRVEDGTRALLLRDAGGRPRLRLSAPLATDARGQRRLGRYDADDGGDVTVSFDWRGLSPPLVVDPTFTLPFWSILSDARVPAAEVYDPTLLSREWRLSFDSGRGRTVLVRPVRPQLDTDTTFLSGSAASPMNTARTILPTPRTHLSAPFPSPQAAAEFQRGYDLESETWEWDGTSWSLNETARLPGLVDPAMTFDASRGVTVLYGGGPPGGWGCSTGISPFCGFGSLNNDRTATYEYDGVSWTTRRVPGSPPPRVRAAMAWSSASSQVLLFGGRATGPASLSIPRTGVDPDGPPYPDNMATDLLNDTWTYDGARWTPVATGTTSPPAVEGAQLLYDTRRDVFVLVGGHSAGETPPAIDRLGIWEFDGTDWTQKLAPADTAQPPSIRTRYGASAFYNPVRQRITIFGGTVAKLDFCTLTDAQIAAQLQAAKGNAAAMTALQATGCLGGYVHDAWEWDGNGLTKVADVVFGGTTGPAQQPVFAQVAGGAPWSARGGAPGGDAGPFASAGQPLLPYRYDRTGSHFVPRTQLERAHFPDGGAPAPEPPTTGTEQRVAGPAASPLFGARIHADVVFDGARGVATVFAPDSAAVYDTDGAAWITRTPPATPFARGPNDFLATAWDPGNQRIVAFDPRDASTWSYVDAGGWTKLPTVGPPPWGVDPSFHSKRDFVRTLTERRAATEAQSFTAVLARIPKMTFDRHRGRAVMLYQGATWEFDGSTWTSAPLPATWSQCPAATFLAFDGARGVTVAFGCNVPGDTWQWDGTQWTGPGPTPFTGLVQRNFMGLTILQQDIPQSGIFFPTWYAPMQLAWAHPNAAFESATLGGVSVIDADGTLRTWNGTAWTAGPTIPTQGTCFSTLWNPSQNAGGTYSAQLQADGSPVSLPQNDAYWLGREFLPACITPPVIEDGANQRILAFRDGPLGMLELPLSAAPAQRAWEFVRLGTEGFFPNSTTVSGTSVQANPYPFEIMAPETIHLLTQSTVASRQGTFGNYSAASVPERTVQELWWPYRVFVDPGTQAVRFMTNRGMVWQLTGENINGLGDPCLTDADCGQGFCGTEGVCCDLGKICTQSMCRTCKGATPGVCGPALQGQPDPSGQCGTGPCTGTCPAPGVTPSCAYDPTVICGPPPVCANGMLTPGGHCSPQASICIPSTAALPQCPLFNGAPVLSSPCVLPAQKCPNSAGCDSPTSCKAGCSVRADCSSFQDDCNQQGLCVPDQASLLASQQGVTTASLVQPPPLRTNAEIAALLVDAGGFQVDDAGRVLIETVAGMDLMFDPNKRDPTSGLRLCLDYIEACMALNSTIDGCVAAARRCSTSTPWLGDPSGDDCCPQGCLVQYFTARQTSTAQQALQTFLTTPCYAPTTAPPLDAGVILDAGSQ